MTFAAWLGAAALALFVSGVAGCAARSLHDFSRHEFEGLSARRGLRELLGEVLRWHDRALLVTESVQLLAAAASVASVVMALTHRAAVGPPWWEWVTVFAAGAVLLLVVNVWLPWAVARFWGARIVFRTWPAVKLLATGLAPLTAGAWLFAAIGRRISGQQKEESHEESLEDGDPHHRYRRTSRGIARGGGPRDDRRRHGAPRNQRLGGDDPPHRYDLDVQDARSARGG